MQALRSSDNATNPIYVSPGHLISLETAVWLVKLSCKYRIPEPVRQVNSLYSESPHTLIVHCLAYILVKFAFLNYNYGDDMIATSGQHA